ncbi:MULTISPECIES: ribosome small subunit-dependent GTPase A [Burkholderiaceae]|uniref:ribosome small subunit-dependent GTPase A n=1 Tax=Burkholderiaceae TaxID=119060 RepID=UPI00095A82B8|nr:MULTISPECIES: ribosome small subunit-dependent GTPase A [Burkholderiaceae]SIT67955.1 ribosome biogenesis GTPase [Burkholderia sp. b13]
MSGRSVRGAPRRTGPAATQRGGDHDRIAGPGKGRVIAAHGRHYVVQPDRGGSLLQCFPRGKKSEVAVGDRVSFEATSADQGVIVATDARRNLLFRSDQFKSKRFAANLDQLLIVLATEPHFSEDLLGRALVAAEAHQLEPVVVLNKADLLAALPLARKRVAFYAALGYRVVEVSATGAADATHATLAPLLAHRATLLLGQSGMGKSTLVNLLVPHANATTRDISSALNSGRHTTTFTRWYTLPNGGALIDSPGFQEFGLYHLTEGQLERAFPEFRPLLGGCRFYNCHHVHEPGCAILDAVAQGCIAPTRHALYAQLLHEASQVVR